MRSISCSRVTLLTSAGASRLCAQPHFETSPLPSSKQDAGTGLDEPDVLQAAWYLIRWSTADRRAGLRFWVDLHARRMSRKSDQVDAGSMAAP
jgi:hypothetical protein